MLAELPGNKREVLLEELGDLIRVSWYPIIGKGEVLTDLVCLEVL